MATPVLLEEAFSGYGRALTIVQQNIATTRAVEQLIEEWNAKTGWIEQCSVNIVLCGSTGAGKSALINSLLGSEALAKDKDEELSEGHKALAKDKDEELSEGHKESYRDIFFSGWKSWSLNEWLGPEEADGYFRHKRERLISGVYFAGASGKSEAVKLKMEHCAKLSLGHKWNVAVKVCAQDSKINQKKKLWVDIKELYPDAIVEMSKNSIEVTLNSPKENHQFAVFGTPDVIDKKRMQLGLFGEKPVTGRNWKILPILFDDTVMAYQNVCKAEKARGRQLLTTLAGLFVSNSDQDVEINFRDVELGWKVKGGKTKIIRSKDAWNSPEDCTDFPRCFIEISHEHIKKRSFTFALIVSHEHDYAETEVIAYYEDPVKVHIEKGQKP